MITIGGLLVPIWVAGSCITAWLASGSQTCSMSIHILESRAKRICEKKQFMDDLPITDCCFP